MSAKGFKSLFKKSDKKLKNEAENKSNFHISQAVSTAAQLAAAASYSTNAAAQTAAQSIKYPPSSTLTSAPTPTPTPSRNTTPTKFEFEPMRSWNDFCGKESRFDLPKQNRKKTLNRILANLLYYQTNYFAVYFLSVAWYLPSYLGDFMRFFLILGLYVSFIKFFTTYVPELLSGKERVVANVVLVVFSVAKFTYFVGLISSSFVMVVSPLIVVLVHAALRLRNFNNKVYNMTVSKSTPMHKILALIGKDGSEIRSANARMTLNDDEDNDNDNGDDPPPSYEEASRISQTLYKS